GKLRFPCRPMIDSIDPKNGGSPADLKKARRKKIAAEPLRTDRLPPHSIEAEQGVLGAIMLSPNDNMGECIEKFKSGAEVFYDLRHQAIFEVLSDMYEGKQPIDLITL